MRMPALYIGHGAPPLLEHPTWRAELQDWAAKIPTPKAILIISAHWEDAPLMVGATTPQPLIYDFYGFPERFYKLQYNAPGAPELAQRIAAMMPDNEPLAQLPNRGLDHGAYVPLMIMYPEANIPVLQMSLPTHDPVKLFEIGQRIKQLREEGVLVIGSGFLTHGLPFTDMSKGANQSAPGWSIDFDAWANEALKRGDVEALMNYKDAPAFRYAHPTIDHLIPMYVTLGMANNPEQEINSEIDGFWYGLSKRSFAVA